MKQTSIEWLLDQLQAPCRGIPLHIIEQAKQMHKEEIVDAWRNGDNDSMYSPKELDKQAENYYKERYENLSKTPNP